MLIKGKSWKNIRKLLQNCRKKLEEYKKTFTKLSEKVGRI